MGLEDVLSIQTVPAVIYKAKYPAWFLSLKNFIKFIENKYEIIFKWSLPYASTLYGYKTEGLGFFLKKNKQALG
jgi:hypothetical protein